MQYDPDTGFYYANIPGAAVVEPDVAYFIEASDASGVSVRTRMFRIDVYVDTWIGEGTPQAGDIFIQTIEGVKRQYFYDVEYYGNSVNGYDLSNISSLVKSPFRKADGTSDFVRVTSQVNATRSPTIQTPHKGLDITGGGRDTYPILDGYVPAGQYGLLSDGTAWVGVRHDLNGTGTFWSYYLHLEPTSVPQSIKNGNVSVSRDSSILGRTSTSAGHLHLSIRQGNGYDFPQYLFWKTVPEWNYGRQVDFMNKPYYVPNTLKIRVVAYLALESGDSSPENVYIWYRQYGAVSFTKASMSRIDTQTWEHTLPPEYNLTTVEYFVGAERPGISSSLVSYRPAMWNQYESGGAYHSPFPDIYWTVYVRGPAQ